MLVILSLNINVLLKEEDNREEVVSRTCVMHDCSLECVNEIKVDVLVVDQHLKYLHLVDSFGAVIRRWLGMRLFLHATEAVENRRSLVLVQGIDPSSLLYEHSAKLGVGVMVRCLEHQMMQCIPLVHIEVVRIHPSTEEALHLLNCEVLTVPDHLNARNLVVKGAEIELTPILAEILDE